MPDLEPITREEKLLDGEDLTPITRKEQFIKRIYDKTQEIPEPITREEMFLKKAGEGGGGDIDLQTLNVTENGTVNAPSGVAYNKVVTDVPQPQPVLDSITITENGTYTPPEGTDGYNEINVNVPAPTINLQNKTVTANGTYSAEQGYDGLGEVTVNVAGNTYLCKNLPVTAHDGTNLGAVTLPNALTIGHRYILFAYYENEDLVTCSGFTVDSGNTYISTSNPSGVFTITSGTTITNTRVASKGVAVSVMEVPDGLDENPFE